MASAAAHAFMAELRANKKPERPLAVERAEWEQEAAATSLPEGTKLATADMGGVPAEWVTCGPVADAGAVLLLHGGGYRAGSIITHRGFAARLSQRFGLRVCLPDYRLAPEHPYPAALEDALAAFAGMQADGVQASQIVVVGDSAGGGLAIALMLALKERKLAQPAGTIAMSPWTDLECLGPSYMNNLETDPNMSRDGLISAGHEYRGTLPANDPRVSPINADLSGLPPTLVQAGGGEIMLSDSTIFTEHAARAGSPVRIEIAPDLWHVFQSGPDEIPEVDAAMKSCAAFVERALKGAPKP